MRASSGSSRLSAEIPRHGDLILGWRSAAETYNLKMYGKHPRNIMVSTSPDGLLKVARPYTLILEDWHSDWGLQGFTVELE